MNSDETIRIQKWIKDLKIEIRFAKRAEKYYKDDPELKNYWQGYWDACMTNLEDFNFYLNEWGK